MILSTITDLNNDSMETYGVIISLATVLFFFFAPFFLYYTYSVAKVKRWENSILNGKGDRNNHNFGLAYVILIGMMLKQDPREQKVKSQFLQRILDELAADAIDVSSVLNQLQVRDVRVKHVAEWTNLRLSHVEREELLYALIEVVYMDEVLIRKEMSLLLDFVKYTHVTKRELESMMSSHKQRLAREAEEQRQAEKRRKHHKSLAYRREKAFKVLGVSPYAGEEEIKKAYRELVKRYHPDRFYGKELSLQKAAKARFIEIQKAYELISN